MKLKIVAALAVLCSIQSFARATVADCLIISNRCQGFVRNG